jgi:lipoyl(octanoyl) transferase
MRVRDLGRVDYVDTWQAMKEFTARRDSTTPDELWLVEHPPVYTLGQSARREHLHWSGATSPRAIAVVHTDRGGQVTYHGPGQIVVYTLIDLRRAGFFVRELVYRIEQSVIQVLEPYDLDGQRIRGAPGVYVRVPPYLTRPSQVEERFEGMAKIAALGIKVHRGCSYHGVALNVAMDLEPFSAIDPCGYRGLAAVDLATLGVCADWGANAQRLIERLGTHLAPHQTDEVPVAGRGRESAIPRAG